MYDIHSSQLFAEHSTSIEDVDRFIEALKQRVVNCCVLARLKKCDIVSFHSGQLNLVVQVHACRSSSYLVSYWLWLVYSTDVIMNMDRSQAKIHDQIINALCGCGGLFSC